MSENQINVFCKNCNSVIYVGRELTVEEQSDTKIKLLLLWMYLSRRIRWY